MRFLLAGKSLRRTQKLTMELLSVLSRRPCTVGSTLVGGQPWQSPLSPIPRPARHPRLGGLEAKQYGLPCAGLFGRIPMRLTNKAIITVGGSELHFLSNKKIGNIRKKQQRWKRLCLSICLSVCLSVIVCLSVSLSLSVSLCLCLCPPLSLSLSVSAPCISVSLHLSMQLAS